MKNKSISKLIEKLASRLWLWLWPLDKILDILVFSFFSITPKLCPAVVEIKMFAVLSRITKLCDFF